MPKVSNRSLVLRDVVFWIGVAFVVATLSVVACSNTTLMRPLERSTVPLSWILAGAAVTILFIAERLNSAATQQPPPAAAKAPPELQRETGRQVAAGLIHSAH